MKSILRKLRTITPCEHPHVVVVRSAGLERTVCESCGHVSFSFDQRELDMAGVGANTSRS